MRATAPHRNGFPIHPRELDLPKTVLNPSRTESFNNHHRFWTSKEMGRLIMTQVLRDLKESQVILPKDTHAIYHDRYTPAPIPPLGDIMNRLDEAYAREELLRYGTAANPTYKVLTEGLWKKIKLEYETLK